MTCPTVRALAIHRILSTADWSAIFALASEVPEQSSSEAVTCPSRQATCSDQLPGASASGLLEVAA